MRKRIAKSERMIHVPWKRDLKGHPKEREPVGSCCVCNRLIYDNVDNKKLVICALCTQALMAMDGEKRQVVRDKIRERVSAGEL